MISHPSNVKATSFIIKRTPLTADHDIDLFIRSDILFVNYSFYLCIIFRILFLFNKKRKRKRKICFVFLARPKKYHLIETAFRLSNNFPIYSNYDHMS